MRNVKKFLALVLAFVMAMSLMVTVNAANSDFVDAGDIDPKFEEAVDVLSSIGIFQGTEENGVTEFAPKATVTRAQMVAVIYRLATGDVDDARAHLYKEYANFKDVSNDAWYAGYVGYCFDAGIIVGFSDGSFVPTKAVTGYEALTMLLRTVGYGKNHEFEGANWKLNVGSTATGEGLLKNVNNSSYAGTLNNSALREMLAEITFQAAQIPTVTYQYGTYNKYKTMVTITGRDNELNDSLGQKWFGLDSYTGIIVGNQQTGEDYTLLGMGIGKDKKISGVSYIYETTGSSNSSAAATTNDTDLALDGTDNVTLAFNTETGVGQFGHQVKIWFDNRTAKSKEMAGCSPAHAVGGAGKTGVNAVYDSEFAAVYTVIDQVGKTAVVCSAQMSDATDKDDLNDATTAGTAKGVYLGGMIKDAGFTIANNSKVWKNTGFDAMTSSAELTVSGSTKVGTSAQNVYLAISNSAADKNGKYPLDMVIALDVYVESIDEVNNYSNPKTVTGDINTSTDIDRSKGSSTTDLLVYGNEIVKAGQKVVTNKITGTVTGTITYWGYDALTAQKTGVIKGLKANGDVTLDDNTVLPKSPLFDMTTTTYNMLNGEGLVIGATMTFTLDANGEYVGATEATGYYLYGVYGYWEQTAYDKITYKIQGVTLDGQIREAVITSDEYEDHVVSAHLRHMSVDSAGRVFIDDNNGAPEYCLFYIDSDGNLISMNGKTSGTDDQVNSTNGKMKQYENGTAVSQIKELGDHAGADANTFFPNSVSVTQNGSDDTVDNHYISSDTKFYVFTGWGSTLDVKPYTGVADLVGSSTEMRAYGVYALGSIDTERPNLGTGYNKGVSSVIIEGDNSMWLSGSSFLYSDTAQTSKLKDKNGNWQFDLRVAGDEDVTTFMVNKIGATAVVDAGGDGVSDTGPAANTFYTYNVVNGVYTLVPDGMTGAGTDWGYNGTNKLAKEGTAAGYIKFDTSGKTLYAKDAKVIDVTGTDHGITDYETLRQAVDADNTVMVDVLLTKAGGDTAAVIYVYSFT